MIWGCYLILINIITYYMFGEDKKRAKQQKWRISESTLLWMAFFGGAIGALLGMRNFHHKTQKRKFRILVPVFLVLHLYIGYLILTHMTL